MNQLSYKKIVLDNGLRIILVPKPDSFSTTVLVLVGTGSEYETKENNGISHFLEHLCFKGTNNRPTSFDIANELDSLGAIYNAFTSNEFTGYFAKTVPTHLEQITDIIADIYLNPSLPALEIEKERGVIIEEINYYEDTPTRKVQELFTALLYKDQPAGWDIAGKKEIIKTLKRDDFLQHRNRFYLAQNTVIAIAGAFEEKPLLKLIKNKFQNIKKGPKEEKSKTIEIQKKPETLIKTKNLDQTHLVIGVRAYNLFDKRRFSLELLSDILGGGMSSRLFQKLREELGACYYINSTANLFLDHGYLAISCGVDNKRLKEILLVILEELTKIKSQLVSKKELQTAKNHLMGHFLLSLENSDELASFYGVQEILKEEIMTPEQIKNEIQKVSPKEIQVVAKDIFQNHKLNLALIGPINNQTEIEKTLKL